MNELREHIRGFDVDTLTQLIAMADEELQARGVNRPEPLPEDPEPTELPKGSLDDISSDMWDQMQDLWNKTASRTFEEIWQPTRYEIQLECDGPTDQHMTFTIFDYTEPDENDFFREHPDIKQAWEEMKISWVMCARLVKSEATRLNIDEEDIYDQLRDNEP